MEMWSISRSRNGVLSYFCKLSITLMIQPSPDSLLVPSIKSKANSERYRTASGLWASRQMKGISRLCPNLWRIFGMLSSTIRSVW